MKTKTHYHFCGNGNHRWACNKADCNLSKHASCGHSLAANNSVANYPVCLKQHPKLATATAKRFEYKADKNGFVVLYKGEPVVKQLLTKKAQKADKRHHSTAKKDARQYEYSAAKLVEALDNGNGDRKIWVKIRKVDNAAKAC